MADQVMEKSPNQVRGLPFPKGTVGKPRRPPVGSRNKATMAAPRSA